jgi:hypothetical protein
MKRRTFIANLASTVALPLAARAQSQGRVRRLGFLSVGVPSDLFGSNIQVAFTQGLRVLGWSRAGIAFTRWEFPRPRECQ